MNKLPEIEIRFVVTKGQGIVCVGGGWRKVVKGYKLSVIGQIISGV